MSKFPTSAIKTDYARPLAVYSNLQTLLDRKIVDATPFNGTAVTFSGANFKKIASTVLSGNLAIGSSSAQYDGGVLTSAVAGSFATGSLETVVNSQGLIMNQVDVRDSVTNDIILDTDGKRVYGLLQSANGTVDGTAIGGVGSENLRLVLFKLDATDTLTLVTYTGTVEFTVNKLYSELTLPNFRFNGKTIDMDIASTPTINVRKFIVTSAYQANEIINITTGAGSVAGASTVSGGSITLPSSASAFNTNGAILVYVSQGYQSKGSATQDDVTWQSTTSFSFNRAIDIDEVITIISP